MQNAFKIIISSYNNIEWVEYNLASILNQTYQNYRVVYIDDCSTDGTYEKVVEIVGDNPKFTIVRNEVRLGSQYFYNYLRFLNQTDDEEITIHACGDDWLYDELVLEKLNDYYNVNKVWMTYGEFYVYDGTSLDVEKANPQNTPYPDFVHKHKFYRRDHWRASHLLTFKGFLGKALDMEDMKLLENGEYYQHACDLAFVYPMLEMCSQDKVGVVDFPTYVWNASPKCQERTADRERVDNSYQEIEIRNRKHYKEGLNNGKLPQVRIVGDYRERNSIPTLHTYTYERIHCEYDITVLSDVAIIDYIEGKIPNNSNKKIIAEVAEPAHLMFGEFNRVYDCVHNNYTKFDRILTCDKELLKLPNAVFMNAGAEVVLNKRVGDSLYGTLADDSLIKIYSDKSKLVSAISSNKVMSNGHLFRLDTLQHLSNNTTQVDYYGQTIHSHYLRNVLKDIDGKIDGLKDYMFSIAIENGVSDNYFTEKILDCFLTGTIPIYHGCPNIGDFFDKRGFITFETREELVDIVANLTEKDYIERKDWIQTNYEKALVHKRDNDSFFNKYIKDLL
jgi:hypothetical protein